MLARGGSICTGCGLTLVISRSFHDPSARTPLLHELLFGGSPLQRIAVLIILSLLIGLALIWLGLILAGQWIPSKKVMGLILLCLLFLAALAAFRLRR